MHLKRKKITDYKLILLQRSKGYSLRPSILIDEIEEVATIIKEKSPNTILFVDNCYGEFVEDKEPLEVGADIIAGSLIKNPGGTLVASGGYLIGEESLINKISDSFYSPRYWTRNLCCRWYYIKINVSRPLFST